MTTVLCFALFVIAFSLLFRQAGLLPFDHALFFRGSAYAVKSWQWPTELALLLGIRVGVTSIRRQGIYFAVIILVLAQMFYYFCVGTPLTGDDGISAVPRRSLFGFIDIVQDRILYYFVLACLMFGLILVYRGHLLAFRASQEFQYELVFSKRTWLPGAAGLNQ